MNDTLPLMISLSGTAVFVAYIVFYFAAKRFFGARWRYNILKISLFFFLFPIPYFKYKIESLLHSVLPGLQKEFKGFWEKEDFTNVIVHLEDGTYLSMETKIRWMFIGSVVTLAFIFLIRQLYQYWVLKKRLATMGVGKPLEDYFNIHEIIRLKNKQQIRQSVSLKVSAYIETPFLVGVFKPCIYLPESYVEYTNEDLEMVILHELMHVKHRDLLIKFIGILMVVVNWYNPVCYLVFYEICNMSEIYCDEALLENKDESFVKQYGNLLINIAAMGNVMKKNKFTSRLVDSDKKVLKRRILEMKKGKRKKVGFVSICAGIIICLMGTMTALAYEAPLEIDARDSERYGDTPIDAEDWMQFEESQEEVVEKVPYDEFFVDEAGTIYEAGKSANQNRAYCKHTYTAGTYKNHSKNGNGCSMDYYSAKRCTKCGYFVVGNLTETRSCPKCTH